MHRQFGLGSHVRRYIWLPCTRVQWELSACPFSSDGRAAHIVTVYQLAHTSLPTERLQVEQVGQSLLHRKPGVQTLTQVESTVIFVLLMSVFTSRNVGHCAFGYLLNIITMQQRNSMAAFSKTSYFRRPPEFQRLLSPFNHTPNEP